MSKNVGTFFSTNGAHWSYFFSLARELMNKGYHPVFFSAVSDFVFTESVPFVSQISLAQLRADPFELVSPICHFQVQTIDELHKTLAQRAAKVCPVAIIQDGVCNEPEIMGNVDADFMFVWRDEDREKILQHTRLDSHHVVVVGDLRSDIINVRTVESVETIGICSSTLSSPLSHHADESERYTRYAAEIKELLIKFPDKKFYLKPKASSHEHIIEYLAVDDFHPTNLSITRPDYDILSFVTEIDCLVAFPETSCIIDAFLCGVPHVALDGNACNTMDDVIHGFRPTLEGYNCLKGKKGVANTVLGIMGL